MTPIWEIPHIKNLIHRGLPLSRIAELSGAALKEVEAINHRELHPEIGPAPDWATTAYLKKKHSQN